MSEDNCSECGFHFVASSSEDQRLHRRYHKEVMDGLRRPPTKTDEVVWASACKRVLVVTPHSPNTQRRRAQDLSLIAARGFPFSGITYHADEGLDERDLHIFMGAECNRLVAYLIFEKRSHVWRYTWQEWDAREDVEQLYELQPMWSVGVVWVCRGKRRQGWTRTVIEAATTHLKVPSKEFGWHSPFTEDGEAVVRTLCPDGFYIAK